MPTLTIKGMPDPLYRKLKRRAASHGRSLNSEILISLEQAVSAAPAPVQTLLARADRVRAALASKGVRPLTQAELRKAKASGRE